MNEAMQKQGEMKMKNVYDDLDFFNEYAKMYRSTKGLSGAGEWHQLKLLFPKLIGKKILDLGCGYGWHCKYVAEQGANYVLGIDSSEKMIAVAKERNSHKNIQYRICDLTQYEYPENQYDFVISNLALHYVEDLTAIYKKIYQTLRTEGVFLFNIEHPTFTGSVCQDWIYDEAGNPLYWAVDDYFYPGVRETNFLGKRVTKQHHTLTQILNSLLETGFALEAVEEAMPPQEMMDIPGMKDEMRRPMMLLVKARK